MIWFIPENDIFGRKWNNIQIVSNGQWYIKSHLNSLSASYYYDQYLVGDYKLYGLWLLIYCFTKLYV